MPAGQAESGGGGGGGGWADVGGARRFSAAYYADVLVARVPQRRAGAAFARQASRRRRRGVSGGRVGGRAEESFSFLFFRLGVLQIATMARRAAAWRTRARARTCAHTLPRRAASFAAGTHTHTHTHAHARTHTRPHSHAGTHEHASPRTHCARARTRPTPHPPTRRGSSRVHGPPPPCPPSLARRHAPRRAKTGAPQRGGAEDGGPVRAWAVIREWRVWGRFSDGFATDS